ncbi:MAG: 2-C-methyl-D-erythritol 4-phosphate cytidylyltransferase [Ruminococcaceae bacterium]|nr:2-C-methyl-D-erythritol 4-phosphate cytidylyltransferase [Oscillospiraceae bacterium]
MRRKQKRDYFVSCIVAAGGSGSRMQADINKIFLDINEVPVLAHTLMILDDQEEIDELILVTAEQDIPGCRDIQEEFNIRKLKVIVRGGSTRQESVRNGLLEVDEKADIVLIHDAARPLVTGEVVQRVIDGTLQHDAAAAGVPCKNTLKLTDAEGFIADTPDRSRLYEIQTPQGFRRDLIIKAHDYAAKTGLIGTDDCYLAEQMGSSVKIVEGDYQNIKITTPEDLLLAELFQNFGQTE